jgi:hypothetical protein
MLHPKEHTKAVSTILFVLLNLTSLIIGGLVAYLWVMSSYYNMPSYPSLSVETVVFSPQDFTYFNVTVLNPSNAVSDVNVTAFEVIVEGQNEALSVGTAQPTLPFLLRIGVRQNFKCVENWSGLAGKNLTVKPLTDLNSSAVSQTYVTPMVNVSVSGFDYSEDVGHFNVTVQNSQESAVNVTVTDIRVFDVSVNCTPPLPVPLQIGQEQNIRCVYDWANLGGENLTITVFTDVGFEQVYETNPLQSAFLTVSDVQFYRTDTGHFNITVSSQDSQASATLRGVNVTLADNTTLALETIPVLNSSIAVPVSANGTQTITCLWNWSTHRDEQVIIEVFTKEGFNVENAVATVPSAVIWNASDIQFDLDDLEHFSVNVTSAPASLEGINVTEVDINGDATSMTPVVIDPAGSAIIVCGYNWTTLVGASVNVTVHGVYGQNGTTFSQTATVPYIKVVNASFSNFPTGNPYANITVFNSQYSPFDANVTQISFTTTNNVTSSIDGAVAVPRIGLDGYLLPIGAQVTLTCPWDWSSYSGQIVTFNVQTTEGTFSARFSVG